jgi:hypothetical protein
MSEERPQPSEEEMHAALEAELKKVTVDDVMLQTAVSLINLAGRRAGLVPGTEDERDLEQVQAAIDGVSALLPLLERRGRDEVRPLRDALAQLQMAYAQQAKGAAPSAGEQPAPGQEPPSGEAPPSGEQPPSGEPGPAQRSGRLWVPGQ